jgi:hypothetical protein
MGAEVAPAEGSPLSRARVIFEFQINELFILLCHFSIAPRSPYATIPAQVRAANSRLMSETSSYHVGSAATSIAPFDDDRPESERFAQIDQAIARYKAQRPMAASSPERVAAVASAGPRTFGKRR